MCLIAAVVLCVHPRWLAPEAPHARDAGTAKSWRSSARGCGAVRVKFEARNDLVAFLELPFFYLRAHAVTETQLDDDRPEKLVRSENPQRHALSTFRSACHGRRVAPGAAAIGSPSSRSRAGRSSPAHCARGRRRLRLGKGLGKIPVFLFASPLEGLFHLGVGKIGAEPEGGVGYLEHVLDGLDHYLDVGGHPWLELELRVRYVNNGVISDHILNGGRCKPNLADGSSKNFSGIGIHSKRGVHSRLDRAHVRLVDIGIHLPR